MLRGMAKTARPWAAVADAINGRMAELGWLQKDLERESQVSVATLRDLQRGVKTSYRPDSLAKVSRALGWPSNALWRVAQGDGLPAEVTSNDDDLLEELDAISRRLASVRRRIEQRQGQ